MRNTLLATVLISGMLGVAAQAQTTPAGSRPAGTPATSASSTSNAGQGNSATLAPARSSTVGTPNAATSNNPVDATGKPVGATQSDHTSTVKTSKPKK